MKVTLASLWHWKYNWVRRLYEAFFCEKKNGETVKTLSVKKLMAFVIAVCAIHSKGLLIFCPEEHWSVVLTEKGVSGGVITALIASLDILAGGALAVYGWAKSKGAA